MIVPSEIAEKKFDRVTVGGYKIEEVEAYLREVSVEFAELIAQKEEVVGKIQILADKIEEYRNEEDSLKTTLVAAQKLSNSLIKEAQDKAEVILLDAKLKADKLIEDASGAIELEHEAFNRLKKEVADFKNKLLGIYKSHIETINNLPDTYEPLSRKPEMPPPAPAPEIEVKPPEPHTETKAFEPVREEPPKKRGISIADEIVAGVLGEAVPEPPPPPRQSYTFGQGPIEPAVAVKSHSADAEHAEPLKFGDNFSFGDEKRRRR